MYLAYISQVVLFIIIFANKIKAVPPSAAIKRVQGDDRNSPVHKSREKQNKPDEWGFLYFEDAVLIFQKPYKSLLTGSKAALNTTLSGMNQDSTRRTSTDNGILLQLARHYSTRVFT